MTIPTAATIYNNLKIHISIGRTQAYLSFQCVLLVVPISLMLAWKLFRPKYELLRIADQAEKISEIILQSDQPDLSNSLTRLLNY